MNETAERIARRNRAWKRIALSSLLCFFQTTGAVLWLKADGPLAWIFAYCFIVEAFFAARLLIREGLWFALSRQGQVVELVCKTALAVLLLFGAAVIVIGLDITPASAYLAWFQLVREGVSGGTLAYMFAVKYAFFAALFAGLAMVGSASFALLSLAAIDLLICAVLLGDPSLAAVGAGLFLVALIRRATSRNAGRRLRASLAVLQIAVVSAVVAVPLSSVHIKNPLIDSLFSIRMEGFVARLFPNFPFLYNVPGYGYSLATSKIGDRPALTSRPVFEITAPAGSTVYIRTGVYDTYNGSGWELSNIARRSGERDILRFEATARRAPEILTDRITFKVLIDFYSSLPHTLGTVAFRFPGESTPQLGVAGLGAGFVLDSPLRRGSEIVDLVAQPGATPPPVALQLRDYGIPPEVGMTRRGRGHFTDAGVWGRGPGRFDSDFGGAYAEADPPPVEGTVATEGSSPAGAQSSSVPDPDGDQGAGFDSVEAGTYSLRGHLAATEAKYGLQYGRYLLTPWERRADLETGPVPERLAHLANRLGAGKSSADTLRAIRNYLVENYSYSLSSTTAGPYHDAVSNFLFDSKTGFCVQFASAFVVLARLNGIPARYVTGFLANLPSGSDKMTVTGLSAHSWAETWNSQLGWVTQEATPPMLAAAAGDPNVLQQFNPTDSSFTQRQLEALLGGRLNQRTPAAAASPQPSSADLTKIAAPFPGAPFIAATLVAVMALLFFLFRLSVVRLSPVDARFRRVVRQIAKRSKARGYPDPAKEGWRRWSQGIVERLPERAPIARRAATLIHRSFFAGRRNGYRMLGRDVVFLRRLYRALLRRKRRDVPVPRQETPVP